MLFRKVQFLSVYSLFMCILFSIILVELVSAYDSENCKLFSEIPGRITNLMSY